MQTHNQPQDLLDVVIIGGGPIGIACAIEAQKRNLSYVVIEKGPLVNSLYHYPTNMTFFSSSEKLEIDQIPFISKNAKPSKAEALEYYRRIATSKKLDIHLFEKVNSVKKEDENESIQYPTLWEGLTTEDRDIICLKLNTPKETQNWFNIRKNL